MRPKVIITVLALAAAILMLVGAFFKTVRPRTDGPVSVAEKIPAIQTASSSGTALKEPPPARSIPAGVPGVFPSESNRAQIVADRVAELQALAMNDDSNSLGQIVAELTNPDASIRKGARDAVVQFGGRAAIPRLKELAEQTEDPAEKNELLEAANFLSLPSLMDYHPADRISTAFTNRPRRNPFATRPPPRS